MAKEMQTSITIAPAQPEQRAVALRLTFSDLPEDEANRQIAAIEVAERRGDISFDGLFVATQGDHLLGAMWSHVMPGRTAVVRPPQRCEGESIEVEARLVEGVIEWLRRERLIMAQVMLPIGIDLPEAMQSQGFSRVADLLFMVGFAESFPADEVESDSIELVHYSPSDRARLERLVEATYEGTLDCPGLDGLRDMTDVLEGYAATGEGGGDLWLIVRQGEEDVGCLLLADHPSDDQVELVYMGVTPTARGSGLGLVLTRQAQQVTIKTGRARLVLAVDAANQPAIAAYKNAGLRPWDHIRVWLMRLMEE